MKTTSKLWTTTRMKPTVKMKHDLKNETDPVVQQINSLTQPFFGHPVLTLLTLLTLLLLFTLEIEVTILILLTW